MYKLLLAWRYLRTRYIALASIISVTLGVGTLIVVNSVMAGFAHEMHVRLHGILADIVLEGHGMDGFADPLWHMAEVKKIVGDDLVGITAAVHVPAMINMNVRGQWITRQVNLIGVDEATYAEVSDFRQYLLHPENQKKLSFHLRETATAMPSTSCPPAAGSIAGCGSATSGNTSSSSGSCRRRWTREERGQHTSPKRKRGVKVRERKSEVRVRRSPDRPPLPKRLSLPLRPRFRKIPSPPRKTRPRSSIRRKSNLRASSWASPSAASGSAIRKARCRTISSAARATTCEYLPLGRHAAEGAQRSVHGRRFLRKQDERVRQRLCLRPAPRACRRCAA